MKSPVPATRRHRRDKRRSLVPRTRHGASARPSLVAQLVPSRAELHGGIAHGRTFRHPEASTMEALRGRSEALSASPHRSPLFQVTASLDARIVVIVSVSSHPALSSSPHRSPLFQDTASLDATCSGVSSMVQGKQLLRIAVNMIVSLSLSLTPCTSQSW